MTYERNLHTVLPSGSTPLEKGMVYAFDTEPHERVITTVLDVDNCPLSLLPWLAWSLNIDTWSSSWPEDYKRQVIKNAQNIQAIKGTIGAVKQALADLGHDNAVVVERVNGGRYYSDGSPHNGAFNYGEAGMWATFKVSLTRPISIQQAQLITARLDNVKRACVHLIGLDFSTATLRYNDQSLKYDGKYTHGTV